MEWFRMYTSVLHDPKVQRLSPTLFKHWVNILCIANQSEERGMLPTVSDIAFQLRIKPSEAERVMAQLRREGLIDSTPDGREFPHNWPQRQRKSDDVATRVRRHRAASGPRVGREADATSTPASHPRAETSRNEAYSDNGETEHVTLPKRYSNALDTDTDTEDTNVSPSEVADAPLGQGKRATPLFPEDSQPYKLALTLRDAIKKHTPTARLPKTRGELMKWATVFDLMIRIDKREPSDVASMIQWATSDSFWQSVILSPGNLRTKYDALCVRRRNNSGPRTSQNGHAPQKQPVSARAAGFVPASESNPWKD